MSRMASRRRSCRRSAARRSEGARRNTSARQTRRARRRQRGERGVAARRERGACAVGCGCGRRSNGRDPSLARRVPSTCCAPITSRARRTRSSSVSASAVIGAALRAHAAARETTHITMATRRIIDAAGRVQRASRRFRSARPPPQRMNTIPTAASGKLDEPVNGSCSQPRPRPPRSASRPAVHSTGTDPRRQWSPRRSARRPGHPRTGTATVGPTRPLDLMPRSAPSSTCLVVPVVRWIPLVRLAPVGGPSSLWWSTRCGRDVRRCRAGPAVVLLRGGRDVTSLSCWSRTGGRAVSWRCRRRSWSLGAHAP